MKERNVSIDIYVEKFQACGKRIQIFKKMLEENRAQIPELFKVKGIFAIYFNGPKISLKVFMT